MRKMIFKSVICLFLVHIISSEKVPEVHEITDDITPEPIRIVRNPNRSNYNQFNFKAALQQDQLRLRYARQQQVDSYLRAYHQQQRKEESRRKGKGRKIEGRTEDILPPKEDAESSGHEYKKLNEKESNKNLPHFERLVAEKTSFAPVKKQINVEVLTNNTNTNRKISKKSKAYQVNEEILDQEVQPSQKREARLYVAQPPSDYQHLYPLYGYQQAYSQSFEPTYTVPKTELEALNSLIGKSPSAQLHGLSQILGVQDYSYAYPQAVTEAVPHAQAAVALPQIQSSVEVAQLHATAAVPQLQSSAAVAQLHGTAAIPQLYSSAAVGQLHDLAAAPQLHSSAAVAQLQASAYDNVQQYASKYAFGYKIKDFHSGANFGHEEVRDGHTAKGHYHVALPDGRIQNVNYWADDTGYHAKVTYSNVAYHL